MLTIYSSHFPNLEILYALILEFLAHILFWNQKNHVDVAFILVSFTWVLFYLTLMNSNVLWSAHLFPVCRATCHCPRVGTQEVQLCLPFMWDGRTDIPNRKVSSLQGVLRHNVALSWLRSGKYRPPRLQWHRLVTLRLQWQFFGPKKDLLILKIIR